jgi:hypothetical protein
MNELLSLVPKDIDFSILASLFHEFVEIILSMV